MQLLIEQVNKAMDAGLYYLAFVASMTLPDICSAVESENGWATQEKYVDWCDLWLKDYFPSLTGSDLYGLRCGVLHKGQSTNPGLRYETVAFGIPEPGKITPHRQATGNKLLVLNVETFCRDIVAAAQAWYRVKGADPVVVHNMEGVMRMSPMGTSGFSPMIWDGQAFGSKAIRERI